MFGIAEGTARVALSRMVANGELTTADGFYELAGGLRRRRREQEWSLAPRLRSWRGAWRMAAVEPVARTASERQALRDTMQHLRCAELREGLWVRPDNLPADADPGGARSIADAQCGWWTARPATDAAALADRLFAPAAWAARGDGLLARLTDVTERLDAGAAGLEADAFLAGAAALVHVRADPLLPDALLPTDWPGAALRTAYGDYRAAFGDKTARWFRRNHDRAGWS